MKKILGLDIGTTSIGWAITEASDEKPIKKNEYLKDDLPETKTDTNNQRTGIHIGQDGLPAVGVRIIPQGDIGQRFDSGKKLNEGKKHTPTADRRIYRSARKTKSRYKLRRDKLCTVLEILGMLPDASYEKINNKNGKEIWKPIENKNSKWYTKQREYEKDEYGIKKKKREKDIGEQLYELRNDAINPENKIELKDWGRILLHLNQWRGYSSDRYSSSDEEVDKDYHPGKVLNVSNEPLKIIYEDETNEKIKYKLYEAEIEFDKPIVIQEKVGDETIDKTLTSIKGNLYVQELRFEKDDLITFSFEILKNETKIKYIRPKPESPGYWKYKYFLLNKDLKTWCNNGGTVGSYFYNHHSTFSKAKKNSNAATNKILTEKIRNIVVNRKWYEDEFEKIWKPQFQKYKEHFTEELINKCVDAAFTKNEEVKKQLKKITNPEERLKILIRDKIIYYQRSWQQSKNKGECRFEKIPDIKKDKDGKIIPHPDGKEHLKGRTVIPRSHPLHQEYKIWQQINNVRIWFHPKDGKEIELTENENLCSEKLSKTPSEIKILLYERLQNKKEQSWRTFINELFPALNLKLKKADKKYSRNTGSEYYSVNYIKLSKKREEQDNLLKGNKTKKQIAEILSDKSDEWFSKPHEEVEKKRALHLNDEKKKNTCINPITNLQLLWEIIYDITDYQAGNDRANIEMTKKKIRKHFNNETITEEQYESLAKIKFDDSGMGNLSARAIRKLLPLMVDGKFAKQYPYPDRVKVQVDKLCKLNQEEQNETNDDLKLYSLKEFISDKKARKNLSEKMSEAEFRGLNYWEAAAVVYGNHSKVGITNISSNEVWDRMRNLQTVKPGSMNNPVVEKIVNETIKLVQLVYQTYGFDELRIELSRELKASREEREAMWDSMNNNKVRNDLAKKMLREMFNGEEISEIDSSASSSNIDKIKIIEDVVANLKGKEHIEKKKEYKISEPTKADIKKYRHWLEQEFKCPYTNQPIPFSDVFAKIKKVEIEHIIPRERYRDNSYSNRVITWVEINTEKAKYGNRTAYEFIVSKRNGINTVKVGNNELELVAAEKWEEHVNKMFKGRKAKNLLRKNIPEDPINRELKETQYINKKLRERLGEAIGFDKVWTTTGQITDMLRNAWHLNDKVMQELLKERFEKFKPPMGQGTTIESIPECNLIYDNEIVNKNTGEIITSKEFPNYSKRLDHRHHALDAIIVACTTQMHIQSVNTLNAKFEVKNYDGDDEEKKAQKIKYNTIDGIIMRWNEDGKPTFKEPWEGSQFIPQVKNALSKIIVSHKNSNILISPSKNKQIDPNNYSSISIRQRLHAETLVGKRKIYNEEQIPIEKIIDLIFDERKKSGKGFYEIIRSIVFKEKFQRQLFSLFEKYTNTDTDEERKKEITEEINANQSSCFSTATTFNIQPIKRGSESVAKINYENVIDKRTQRHLKYRQDWIEEVEKEWKRIKNSKESEKKTAIENKKKLVNNFSDYPIYYNALYDVRLKDGSWKPLYEFDKKMLDEIQYNRYKKGEKKTDINRTEQVKKVLTDYQFEFTIENILLRNPIFIPNTKNKIVIKKATVLNRFGKDDTKKSNADNENKKEVLVEIRPKTFVSPEGKFRALVTESMDEKKEKHFQFIEHLKALQYQKLENDFIKAEIKIPNSLIPQGYKFLFTLTKNDFVIISENSNDKINWNDISELSKILYRVLDFDEAGYIRFVKHTIADTIKLNDIYDAEGLRRTVIVRQEDLRKEKEECSTEEKRIISVKDEHIRWKESLSKEELKFQKDKINRKEAELKADAKSLKEHKLEIDKKEKTINKLLKVIEFKQNEDKPVAPIEETIQIKSYDEMQKIIKVFTNKLGKKIVPYWRFQNGCWNKEKAKELGIIN